MSAFIVSDKHIATIVNIYRATMTAEMSDSEAQALADQLKRWNIRSVNYRYKERTRFKPCDLQQGLTTSEIGKVGLARLISCLEYQSCERPDWKTDCKGAYKQLLKVTNALIGPDSKLQDYAGIGEDRLKEATIWNLY